MAFRSFAGNARLKATANAVLKAIPQARRLTVQRQWRDDEGQHYQELFEVNCYADFAEPKDGQAFISEQVLSNQDYVVRGLDLIQHTVEDYINTASGYWLGGSIVAGEVQGGTRCDLLGYKQHMLCLDLYLRKKPEER